MALVAPVQNIGCEDRVVDTAAEVAKCQRLYESLKQELKIHMKSFDELFKEMKKDLEEFPDMPSPAGLEMDKLRPYRYQLMDKYGEAYYSLSVAKCTHEETVRHV